VLHPFDEAASPQIYIKICFHVETPSPSITRTCIMQANVASWKLIVMLCSYLTGSPTIVYLNVALEIGVKVEESEAMNAHCS
jgi:hypothetical protein